MKEFELTYDEYRALRDAHYTLTIAQDAMRTALRLVKAGHPEFKMTKQYQLWGTRKLTQEDNK